MVIVTKYDDETKRILALISPPKILIMRYKSDNALISQAKIGIAFEYGLDDSESVMNATVNDIATILMSYGLINQNPYSNPRTPSPSSIFDVYDAFQKSFEGSYVLSDDIENFKQIKEGQVVCTTETNVEIVAEEDFYPILFGNNRYKDILGFKAKNL